MEHFVNEYHYTPQLSEESLRAWWKWKLKKPAIFTLVFLALSVVLLILHPSAKNLLLVVLAAGIFVMMKFKANAGVKTEKERLRVLYPDEPPVLTVEVGEKITLKSPQNERAVQFADVEAILETPNLFVLCVKGSLTLAISKTGFTEGSAESCRAYLKAKTGK